MRNLAAALFVGFLSCAQQAAAQPASDSVEYDKAVARVWGSITSTENVVRWCTKNVPKSKKPIETGVSGMENPIRAADRRNRYAHRSGHEFQWCL